MSWFKKFILSFSLFSLIFVGVFIFYSNFLCQARDLENGGQSNSNSPTAALLGETTLAPREVEESRIISAYKQANKAVVNINTRGPMDFFGHHHQEGSGSGVIIDNDKGYVLTNGHVVQGADKIAITISSGTEL